MPSISPGKTTNPIDSQAVSGDRTRRNWQRLARGGVNKLIQVDGVTIGFNALGQLEELNPIVINEIPGGSVDGSNATFTLGNPPIDGQLLVFVDGVQMVEGNDYSVSGSTFTFTSGAVPMTGDSIRVTYRT